MKNNKQKQDSIEMTVSPITHTPEGKPQVYVQFKDGDRIAEGRIPGMKILSQTGFSDEEVAALEEYMKAEKAAILSTAKRNDVMSALFGNLSSLFSERKKSE